jgi:hypothetical protein
VPPTSEGGPLRSHLAAHPAHMGESGQGLYVHIGDSI